MTRLLGTAAFALASLTLATGTAWSSIQLKVVPAFAPNGNANPADFSLWAGNAISALESGSMGGARTQPEDYEAVADGTVISPREIIISGDFNSWRGFAAPTSGWDGATGQFASQHGNRVHFGLRIWSDSPGDSKFSLEDVFFEIDSNDPQDTFDFPDAGDPLPTLTGDYRDTLVGIDYGVDGVKGGGDDIRYDSSNPSAGSTLVNEILYVGVGTAYDATGFGGTSDQEKIDNLISEIENAPFSLRAAYELVLDDQVVGRGTSGELLVPEPAGLALAGLSLLGLVGAARRRRGA